MYERLQCGVYVGSSFFLQCRWVAWCCITETGCSQQNWSWLGWFFHGLDSTSFPLLARNSINRLCLAKREGKSVEHKLRWTRCLRLSHSYWAWSIPMLMTIGLSCLSAMSALARQPSLLYAVYTKGADAHTQWYHQEPGMNSWLPEMVRALMKVGR